MERADASDADVRAANLKYADLSYVNFTGARLKEADLSGADVHGLRADADGLGGVVAKKVRKTDPDRLQGENWQPPEE